METAKKDYFLLGSGKRCNDHQDWKKIENSTECRYAANKIESRFAYEQDDEKYPGGCYEAIVVDVNEKWVFFNSNTNNVRQCNHDNLQQCNPICWREGKILRECQKIYEKYSNSETLILEY